jgi:predicted MFS family arabinose efflux permease
VAASLGFAVYAIIEGPNQGWDSSAILLCFAVAGCAVVGLLLYEPRRSEPLVELRFFRSAPFSGATLTAVVAFAGFGMFLFLNTLYLQEVRGFSPVHAGIYTLPLALATLVCAPISGRMVGAFGPRPPLFIAGACVLVSALMLTGLSTHTELVLLLASYLIFGIATGMVNSPITAAAVAGMPRDQAGVAAAVATTSRQVGQALGVAIGGSIVGGAGIGLLGPRFVQATHPAWWLLAATGVLMLLVTALTTGRRALRTAMFPELESPLSGRGADSLL